MRPIGEEFWHEFNGHDGSNETHKTRILYRVTAHEKAVRFVGDTQGTPIAITQPIRVQHAPLLGYSLPKMEPQFGEWKDVE